MEHDEAQKLVKEIMPTVSMLLIDRMPDELSVRQLFMCKVRISQTIFNTIMELAD